MKSADAPVNALAQSGSGEQPPSLGAQSRARAGVADIVLEWFRSGAVIALTPWIILVVLVVLYGARQSGVYTVNELNTFTGETLTLILIAFGQTLVIVSGGIDLSIGGILSLVTSL